MKRIFISYRRDDSKWPARQIYDAFLRVLPHERLFMDIDSIPPGADFVEVLEGWVDKCDVLLALIGSGWIGAIDPKSGQRRLDNPMDFVRIEIREALMRSIPVVPILLDGAPMPSSEQLPEDLRNLVRKQAEVVEFRTFAPDVQRLIKKLGLVETVSRASASSRSLLPDTETGTAKSRSPRRRGLPHSSALFGNLSRMKKFHSAHQRCRSRVAPRRRCYQRQTSSDSSENAWSNPRKIR